MSAHRFGLMLSLLLALGCGAAGGGPAAPGGGLRVGTPGGARVTLLQTTDLHAHARDSGTPDVGGYARIAAYVETVRATAGHPVVLVDSGDWSMGTLYDLTLGRRPLPLWFADALRYDCITLGNHEFDHTPAGLALILETARSAFGFRTPIVASNLDPGGDPRLAPLVGPGRTIQPARVQTLANGVRVGYLGLMGRDAAGDAASAPARFADYGRDPGLVQRRVDDLRDRQGCDLVIALSHAGTRGDGAAGEDVDLARSVRGIDVIASGHTHNPLAAARPVANGGWRTLVVCAGAFGTHVSRLDLVLRPGGGVDLEHAENRPMTGAGGSGLGPPASADPAFGLVLAGVDRSINRALGGVLAQLPGFGPDAGADPARGIDRPVAACEADLGGAGSAGGVGAPGPGGLGNLCADALRTVANGCLVAAREAGGDATPFTAAAVATGELRGGLRPGRPVTFSDVFDLLPLGLSPDPDQAEVTGEPLVSAYLEPGGCRVLCALQLLAQAGLVGGDLYPNLSGLAYDLDPAGAAGFFTAAGAAVALEATGRRAGEGSTPAARALAAVAALPGDGGAALRTALAEGNPYAGALVRLMDPQPDSGRIAANLEAVAQVAGAAAADPDGSRLAALLMARAVAAIGPLSAFAPGDPACTGPAAPLGPGRIRVVVDLYLLQMADRVQARLGTRAILYRAARGDAQLSADTPRGLRAVLAGRVFLPSAGEPRELKAWQAVLLYLVTPPAQGGHFRDGRITAEYAAPADPGHWPEAGAAVRVRNAAYPRAQLAALAGLAASLRSAP